MSETITKPFKPTDETEYAVTYIEDGQKRVLFGCLEFPEQGIIVHRTRSAKNQWVWLPRAEKIEVMDG